MLSTATLWARTCVFGIKDINGFAGLPARPHCTQTTTDDCTERETSRLSVR